MNDNELFNLYSKEYFFGYEYSNYLADKKIIQKNFKLRLKVLREFVKHDCHKSLLEIGCAYGFFLDMASDSFQTTQGIDITKDGVSYAKEELKLNVIHADFLKHDFGDQKFDVVCMWDTIEHLRYPQLYLEKMIGLMEEGSLVAITTGDIDSINAKARRKRWRLLKAPTHLHFFSKTTLEQLLAAYGFDIIYNRYCGFYRSVDMAAYKLFGINEKSTWLYNLLRKSKITNINFYLNLYDIMYVIARKR